MDQMILNADLKEIIQGYKETEDYYICLVCGKMFEKGEIFEENDHFYDAKKMVEIHTEKEHGRIIDILFELHGKHFGLTNSQLGMLRAFAYDKSEEEIYEEFQITPSTIRNYRQKLREKQQQAKLLSALSELVRDEKRKGTMHLNRKEKAIIQQYFTQDGYLKEIPSKSKKKFVVLKHIIQPLKTGKKYSENELNKYLKSRTVQCSEVKESLMEQGLIIVDEQNNYYKKLK